MAKMLLLDGPLAGQLRDMLPDRTVQANDFSTVPVDGMYRQVTYQPHEYLFCTRMLVVGTCGTHDRRRLEELAFQHLASGIAKQAAGPMPRYVCDHQAYDTRCPQGCHDGERRNAEYEAYVYGNPGVRL